MAPAKIRVYELSKALDISNKDLMGLLEKEFGIELKSHSSSIEHDVAAKITAMVKQQKLEQPKPEQPKTEQQKTEKSTPKASAVKETPKPKEAPKPEPKAEKPAPPTPSQPMPSTPKPLPPQHRPASGGTQRSPLPPQPQAPKTPEPKTAVAVAETKNASPAKPDQKPVVHGTVKGAPETTVEAPLKIVKIHDPLTVSELAQKLNMRETEIIKHLFMKGAMVTVNQTLDTNYAKSIAKDLGFDVEEAEHPALQKGEYNPSVGEKKAKLDSTKYKNLQHRSPVVSIMGHVDHGKTSLLDAIRETRHKIVDSEAGGITQSIGAYTVEKDGQRIVFLDTPGHEAFTSMRMRGAQATDIAILVVAADDGVMPQTIEAINHAKAANIPIIVAVNKIDKAGADPEKVLVQLSEHGLVGEKWGGDTVTVEVSALQKLGLDDLLEMILLVSELLELQADSTVAGEGVIIEAQLDKRKGPVATALVQNGTLKVGDNVLIGPVGGRVRALINDSGERVHKAGPSTPVEILGLGEVPQAGDHFQVIRDEKRFKQLLSAEKLTQREQKLSARGLTPGLVTVAPRLDAEGEVSGEETHDFNIIIKADTQGSAEAVSGAVGQLSTEEIHVKILHTGTGDISEADVMLASASNAVIIGFNVKEDANAMRVVEQSGVRIHKFDVIYHIVEEMEKLMLGKLSPDSQEIEVGQAEVRQLFTVGKNVVIAGCMVLKGKVVRNAKAVVTRNNKEVFSGPLDNLKRFKDDAKEVATGYECGISFDKFNDLQVGDLITVFTVETTERTSL